MPIDFSAGKQACKYLTMQMEEEREGAWGRDIGIFCNFKEDYLLLHKKTWSHSFSVYNRAWVFLSLAVLKAGSGICVSL